MSNSYNDWNRYGLVIGRTISIDGIIYSMSINPEKYGVEFHFQKGRHPELLTYFDNRIKFGVVKTRETAYKKLNAIALKHASRVHGVDLQSWQLGIDELAETYSKTVNIGIQNYYTEISQFDETSASWSIQQRAVYDGAQDLCDYHLINGEASKLNEVYSAIANALTSFNPPSPHIMW